MLQDATKKSVEGNYCNIANKKSAIVPWFQSVSYVFLEISGTFLLNFNVLKM